MEFSAIMGTFFFLLFLSFPSTHTSMASSTSRSSLQEGSSLSVQNPNDVMVSPDGVFTAGFYSVGYNAFGFAVWFTEPLNSLQNLTAVWMANRDRPVNGRRSMLSLQNTGNLILTDIDKSIAWESKTLSLSSVHLQLNNNGNLVLRTSNGTVIWQSFDSPTDTLLTLQPLTQYVPLVSSRSLSNQSSGSYTLFFDSDNLLKLRFESGDILSVFWPDPWLRSWEAGRSTYNNSRTAMFDSVGKFTSSDNFNFSSADYGARNQRRLSMDVDGNLRLYSREKAGQTWIVSWQAIQEPCKIHGVCGVNSFCSYVPSFGRKCSCLPGYKMKNESDWSRGCEPQFKFSCNNETSFIKVTHVEFYGRDYGYYPNYTFDECEKICLKSCCVGFQYSNVDQRTFNCYPKLLMLNGYRSPAFRGHLYVRVPKDQKFSQSQHAEQLQPSQCSIEVLERRKLENATVKVMLWFASGVGGLEILCILSVWCFLIRTQKKSNADRRVNLLTGTGLIRFTYSELKRATGDFSEEVGRGGGGTVYKGILPDQRVAAVKRLNEANQGEAEFLAEVSTIGMFNHMNLIVMWGYCAEGKHRLLVYEFIEHGSLANNLSSKTLDWNKRFQIAVGTAKCLAYLHEECLEWVLHCDIKPQNILLDSDYRPKVADFGLSKLLNRGELNNSSFSKARGTRGYMAPEWVVNLPITSKVDVYSYGIVLLELVTGKSPLGGHNEREMIEHRKLVKWVGEKMIGGYSMASCMKEIMDDKVEGECDMTKMEVLVRVALKCVEEDRDMRPTMSQVVEMLLKR